MDFLVKKLNSRMCCLRKLTSFHITPEILNVFYPSTIVSVWSYCLVCWGGNVSKREKRRIDGIVRKAERVIGECQPSEAKQTETHQQWRPTRICSVAPALQSLHSRLTTNQLEEVRICRRHCLAQSSPRLKHD